MLFLLPLTVCVSVRYVERKDYQYMEMVTDSAYMALLAPLHLVVRPDIRGFYKCYGDWFHRPYCEERRVSFVETQMAVYKGGVAWILKDCCARQLKDYTRTPGLFKVEFEGTEMVGLNSKTYHWWSSTGEKPVARDSVRRLTSLQRRFTSLC